MSSTRGVFKMKRMFFVIVIVANVLMAFESFASDPRENVRRAEAFQYCVDDCMAISDPNFEIRACIAECKDRYIPDADVVRPQFCETYEEGCDGDERDSDDDEYDDDRDDNEEDDGGFN
jgi:hypothetical protein